MVKFWKFIFVLLLVILLIYLTLVYLYPFLGRKLVYSKNRQVIRFPGSGEIVKHFEARILAIPNVEGRAVWDVPENRELYPNSPGVYEVIDIPAQEQMLYAIGYFEGWENIEGTLDKYVLVKYPKSKDIQKFRVAFEESELFKDQATRLLIENVGIEFARSRKNELIDAKPSGFTDLGFERVKDVLKKGDTVVLIPVFDPPELSKKDENGYSLAESVIVRRVTNKL